MLKKMPMPTKKQLAAMTDEEIEQNMQLARAAFQEVKQLARNSGEQERVFTAYEKEQKQRAKSDLKVEAEAPKK